MSDWSSVVTAVEEFATVQETLRFDGRHQAQVALRCPWADRISVAADILNNNRLWPHSTMGAMGAQVVIRPVPGATNGSSISVSAGGLIQYAEAIVQVTYDTVTVGNLEESSSISGQLFSESIEEIIDHQTLDPANFRWGSATGKPMKEGPVRALYGMNFKRTLYNMASIPAACFTLPGTVNNANYVSAPLGVTFAAETLLFAPANFQRVMLTSGTKGWTVSLKYGFKKDGWNKFWNKDKAGGEGYDIIWRLETGGPGAQYKNFPAADHSTLLFA